MDIDNTVGGVAIESTHLFDRLTAILARLATGKKHDPSWMRPLALTYEERKSDYYEAEAIIEELRKRLNDSGQPRLDQTTKENDHV